VEAVFPFLLLLLLQLQHVNLLMNPEELQKEKLYMQGPLQQLTLQQQQEQ